jgi:hypothetical protein
MAKLKDTLATLTTKNVTVTIVGISNADNFAGTLSTVGEDYLELSNTNEQSTTLIPFAAIASLTHR